MLTLNEVRFRHARSADAQGLVDQLSDVDRAHAAAVIPDQTLENAVGGLISSAVEAVSIVAKDDGRLLAVYGYHRGTLLSKIVAPWVLMTQDGRDTLSRMFSLRLARRVVKDLLDAGFLLRTTTPGADKIVRRWLKVVGFEERRGESLIEMEAR